MANSSLPTSSVLPPWQAPAVIAQPWTFTQLGGTGKQFVLSGLDAPWGRPRKTPVVTDEIEVRENTVYYSGADLPTRHIFGLRYEPWELTGRFGDRNPLSSNPSLMQAGNGYAKALVNYIKTFISDQQPVRVQWGNIISAQGFIRKFRPKREAEYEVEWEMTILVDADELTPLPLPITTKKKASDVLDSAVAAAKAMQDFSIPPGPNNPNASLDAVVRVSVIELLDAPVSILNSAIASVLAVTQTIDSIEKASLGELKRLRAVLGQFKTAMVNLQSSYDSITIDSASVQRSFLNDWSVQGGRAGNELSLLSVLAAIEDLDRQAEISERGQAYSSYVAVYGDTWELISTKLFGAPDQADSIRQANGITGGTLPVSGRPYKIPFPNS